MWWVQYVKLHCPRLGYDIPTVKEMVTVRVISPGAAPAPQPFQYQRADTTRPGCSQGGERPKPPLSCPRIVQRLFTDCWVRPRRLSFAALPPGEHLQIQ